MIVKLWMHVLIPYQNIMIDKEHGFYFLFIFMMWLLIPSFEFVQFGVPRDWDSSRWPPVFLYLYGFLQIHSSCLQWWMFNRYISFWVHIYFYWGGGVSINARQRFTYSENGGFLGDFCRLRSVSWYSLHIFKTLEIFWNVYVNFAK